MYFCKMLRELFKQIGDAFSYPLWLFEFSSEKWNYNDRILSFFFFFFLRSGRQNVLFVFKWLRLVPNKKKLYSLFLRYFLLSVFLISNFYLVVVIIIIIIIIITRLFHISVSWWSFTGDWVTASLLKSPGLF